MITELARVAKRGWSSSRRKTMNAGPAVAMASPVRRVRTIWCHGRISPVPMFQG